MTQLIALPPSEAEHQFRTRLAQKLFADEWRAADQTRDPAKTRRMLRARADEVLETAQQMTSPTTEAPATGVTAKPSNVEIAAEKDAAGLLNLIQESDQELTVAQRDYGKVRDIIAMAVDRTPLLDIDGTPLMRPVFGIISDDATVAAACGLFPTQYWDSSEFYLKGFLLYVSQRARRSSHAKSLLQFSHWFASVAAMAVIWEAVNCRMLDERSRLFSRHARPAGMIFIHDIQTLMAARC